MTREVILEQCKVNVVVGFTGHVSVGYILEQVAVLEKDHDKYRVDSKQLYSDNPYLTIWQEDDLIKYSQTQRGEPVGHMIVEFIKVS